MTYQSSETVGMDEFVGDRPSELIERAPTVGHCERPVQKVDIWSDCERDGGGVVGTDCAVSGAANDPSHIEFARQRSGDVVDHLGDEINLRPRGSEANPGIPQSIATPFPLNLRLRDLDACQGC